LGFAHYNLGLIREIQKDWDGVIASFQQAIIYSPNSPEPSYHLGLCYLQKGRIELAKAAFSAAITINRRYAEAHYNLGSILFNQGKLNEALAAFRKSTQANANYADAYYGAGLVFVQLKQYPEAIKVIKYARDLYKKQGDLQWVNKSEKLLTQLQKSKHYTICIYCEIDEFKIVSH
jgi:tetratricopeptide (TPR) repeat protein